MTFFTEPNRVRAKEIVARYPRPKSAILPLAHLAQDQNGWLSAEAMDEIAELTERDLGRGAGHLLLLHDVEAPAVRQVGRVGVHQRDVPRDRRTGDPRAPRGAGTRPIPT